MKRFTQFVYLLNTAAELILGALMVVYTGLFDQLVYVSSPAIFVRMVGGFALCLGLLSGLTLWRLVKKPDEPGAVWDISFFFLSFHLLLVIVLGIAAVQHFMSWLGFMVHAPLAILFAIVFVRLRRA